MARHDSMLEALAWAVRATRTRSGASRHRIAVDADVSPATIYRFERAQAWPWDPEAIVDAVARRACVDPAEIWQAAVNAYTTPREETG